MTWSIRLAEIRWSVCISNSHRILWVIFKDGFRFVHISFVRMIKSKFLHNSQFIPFPTQSCLNLYSFCANLLHSLVMWLIVSSLLPCSACLLFCCVLSIFSLIWSLGLFCAVIRRDSVSLLRFPFFNHVQAFSCEISLVCRLKYPYSCFPTLFVSLLFLFCWSLCYLYCFWSLYAVIRCILT